MKKVIGILMVLGLFLVVTVTNAWAGAYLIDIGIPSGVTTVVSATSPMQLQETDDLWVVDAVRNQRGYFSAQIDEIAAENSGATFTVTAKTSLIDDDAHWAGAEETTIYDGVAISGNTPYVVSYTLPPCAFIRFYLKTWTYRFSKFTMKGLIQ